MAWMLSYGARKSSTLQLPSNVTKSASCSSASFTRLAKIWSFFSNIIPSSLEQNIGIIACSVPALQPLFKQWIDSRSTNGTATPGARNNPVLPSWDDSTCLTSLSHSQSSHSTMNHGFSRGEEPMYPLEERPAKGIWGTNDAGCVYPEASYDRQRQIGHTKEFSLV